jgi:hypothetical protein
VKKPFQRVERAPAAVLARAGLPSGDRVLAFATASDGTSLLGTREALVLVGPDTVTRIPWEQVQTADWDRDEERLRVTEVGELGQLRPVHVLTIADPGRMLEMIRERVTASVLLQRRVLVSGRLGVDVVARRPPHRDGEVTWVYTYDTGLDPEDPAVQEAARAGLQAAVDDLGLI